MRCGRFRNLNFTAKERGHCPGGVDNIHRILRNEKYFLQMYNVIQNNVFLLLIRIRITWDVVSRYSYFLKIFLQTITILKCGHFILFYLLIRSESDTHISNILYKPRISIVPTRMNVTNVLFIRVIHAF